MTNQKLLNLYSHLNTLKGLKGAKFSYCIAKNISTLETEVKSLETATLPTEDYKKYDTERIEIVKKYAKKGENDELIIENNQYIIEDQKSFDKEIKKLQETHKETLEARTKQIEDFNKLLEEQNTIELNKIKLEDIPEDITTEQMVGIYDLISE